MLIWIEIMLETLETESVVGFWLGSPPPRVSVFAKKINMSRVYN